MQKNYPNYYNQIVYNKIQERLLHLTDKVITIKLSLMKKKILSFALVAALIGSIAAGCSSVNETVEADTTAVDTSSITTPRDTVTKTDTIRRIQ